MAQAGSAEGLGHHWSEPRAQQTAPRPTLSEQVIWSCARRWLGKASESVVALSLMGLLVVLAPATASSAAPAAPPWRVGPPWTTERAVVRAGDVTVTAEVAATEPLRERGLGYRDGLVPGTGMLFVYDVASTRTFWMKGMRFCLDIIWIEAGKIVGAAENVCPAPGVADADLPIYASPAPVRYVLEVPAGWLVQHALGAGSLVKIDFTGTAAAQS